MIEHWFRSFKYEEAYLTQWDNIKEARTAIAKYIHEYNFERCHSAIGDVPPATVYYPNKNIMLTIVNEKKTPILG